MGGIVSGVGSHVMDDMVDNKVSTALWGQQRCFRMGRSLLVVVVEPCGQWTWGKGWQRDDDDDRMAGGEVSRCMSLLLLSMTLSTPNGLFVGALAEEIIKSMKASVFFILSPLPTRLPPE